jgi:hypothetical protein
MRSVFIRLLGFEGARQRDKFLSVAGIILIVEAELKTTKDTFYRVLMVWLFWRKQQVQIDAMALGRLHVQPELDIRKQKLHILQAARLLLFLHFLISLYAEVISDPKRSYSWATVFNGR